MPANSATGFPVTTIEQAENLRIDCYVRSDVPGPIAETINALIERLEHLCDHGSIADYQVSQWPAEYQTVAKSDGKPTRDELITEFERWAEQHGQSLEPAFRRKEIPTSPLSLGSDGPRERLQVPFVALALYEDEKTVETDSGSETLRGVVPYTEPSTTGEDRTYTVDEWLSALEAKGCEDSTYSSQCDQTVVLEGQP